MRTHVSCFPIVSRSNLDAVIALGTSAQAPRIQAICCGISWNLVASAVFLRYPNPMATHVLTEDTVHREVRQGGNILYSRRFLTKVNKLPKWGERWMPSKLYRFVPLMEESHVDRDNKTVTTYTRNVGLSTFRTATERVVYQPNPENPSETIAVKEAWVSCIKTMTVSSQRYYSIRLTLLSNIL